MFSVTCEYGVKNRVLEDGVVIVEVLVLFAEVKSEWSCTSTLPIRLHGMEMENRSFSTFIYLFIYLFINSFMLFKRRCH